MRGGLLVLAAVLLSLAPAGQAGELKLLEAFLPIVPQVPVVPPAPAAAPKPSTPGRPVNPVKPAEAPPGVAKPVGPAKRIEINKTTQTLSAYEGDTLFLQTRVSTGKWDRSTPNGSFKAQEKDRMHRSRKYNNAAMPFSIWITGNCFIHGFASVPHYPASHGCVRVPLSQDNPAKKLFEWTDIGTPIDIVGQWPE